MKIFCKACDKTWLATYLFRNWRQERYPAGRNACFTATWIGKIKTRRMLIMKQSSPVYTTIYTRNVQFSLFLVAGLVTFTMQLICSALVLHPPTESIDIGQPHCLSSQNLHHSHYYEVTNSQCETELFCGTFHWLSRLLLLVHPQTLFSA